MKRSSTLITSALAVAIWCALAGSVSVAVTATIFFVAIYFPTCLLVRRQLQRVNITPPLDFLAALALTWIILCFGFIFRKILPTPLWLFDLASILLPWACLKMTVTRGCSWGLPDSSTASRDGDDPEKESSVSSRNSVAGMIKNQLPVDWQSEWATDRWWLLLWLPLLLLGTRIGNEVTIGSDVHFYGLFYYDFGNLRAIVNLLNAADGMPLHHVSGMGPLSYHWLYFGVPAWIASPLGYPLEANGSLTIACYVSAWIFYKSLSHLCAIVLNTVGMPTANWAPWGAAIGIFGTSILGFYGMLPSWDSHDWIQRSPRNQFIMHLPSILNMFGNNTLALTMVALSIAALEQWNRNRQPALPLLAATCVACLPVLSVTMVPGVASGIGIACLLGKVHRPWMTLATFAVLGSLAMALFASMNFFSQRNENTVISFDDFQFLQNAYLSSPLLLLAIPWCLFNYRNDLVRILACLCLTVTLFPTLFLLANSFNESDFAMKNHALLMMLGTPLITALVTTKLREPAWHRGWVAILTSLLILGATNAFIHVAGHGARILRGSISSVSIDQHHYQTLQRLKSESPQDSIVINSLGLDNPMGDPTIIIGARRVYLPSAYAVQTDARNRDLFESRRREWDAWCQSDFRDEGLAKNFARAADFLIIRRPIDNDHWVNESIIGDVHLYRSAIR